VIRQGFSLTWVFGKTVITLTAINELLYNYFDVSNVLVIAPLRVAQTTWPGEVKKWGHLQHLTLSKVLGSAKERRLALNTPADIHIINRENVKWLVEECGKEWPFDMVVIDELSSFKSNKAKRFRALRKVRPRIKRIVGLTGTPAPNGLIDLWPQIYLLDQGERLGKTVTGYRNRYFNPGRRNGYVVYDWVLKPGAEEAIYEKLDDICVSMKSEDWLQMPERIDREVVVRIPEAARARYDQLERDLLLPYEGGDVTADNAAVLSNKLLQMANGAVYDENGSTREIHQAKLEALDDILEAANGQPVLVFYNYQHDRDRILKHIPTARVLDTEDDIEKWNQGEIPVMLAHPASAGHGLNLQAGGSVIVWFGLTWSLELYQQANARLYRQGQNKSVIIHHLVAEGTIDEDVMRALEHKDTGQEALLAAVKARIEMEGRKL
jgi:SNF2 family DNA or RNA helicase